MRVLVIFMLIMFCQGIAHADFYQSNNPFPAQTCPQKLNNIYESEPATIQQERKAAKKSWFKKGENIQQQDAENNINEGIQVNDGSFYVFPAQK